MLYFKEDYFLSTLCLPGPRSTMARKANINNNAFSFMPIGSAP